MEDYNITNASLKRFNTIMGFLHLLQGILMLCFALFIERIAAFKIPIWSYFLTFDKVQQRLITDPKLLWEVPFGIAVSLFLLMSAIAHFIIVSPWGNRIYNQDLNRRMNRFRWYEYAISSSLMIVLIAMLFGVYGIGALMLIVAANASMNLFGLLMEEINQYTEKTNWKPFFSVALLVLYHGLSFFYMLLVTLILLKFLGLCGHWLGFTLYSSIYSPLI
ncbi:hypothetical protein GEMRC1_012860 [Eukaryota sp. GEM-RC1]